MALPYAGRNSGIGLGIETTYGTAVSRTVWERTVSQSLQRTLEKSISPSLAASSGAVPRYRFAGADNAGGSVETEAAYGSVAFLSILKATLGTPVTSGSGPYDHTFTCKEALASYTIEAIRGNGTAEVFEGCKASQTVLAMAVGDLMRVRTDWIAETSGGRVSASSPSYPASPSPIIYHQSGTLAWNSQTFARVTSLDVTLNNGLERRPYLGSALTTEPGFSGFREITLSVTLQWDVDHFISGLTADTSSDAAIIWTGPGNFAMAQTIENAYVTSAEDPISGPGVVSQSVTLVAQGDGSKTGYTVVVTNDTAGGAAYI